MEPFRVFSQKGWRRTGAINVILAYVCAVILSVALSISVSRPGASLSRPTIIFQGSCTSSTSLNLALHLLVNILSGTVLASSSFFMQVLSSPSREEIDSAHSWLRSLDIGIPSVKNLHHVARFKSISWFVFLLSSVPIHLFFNSAIFSTSYMGSQWRLSLATEAFTKGAAFFPPGASLTPAGSAGPGYHWNKTYHYYEEPESPNKTVPKYSETGWLINGYSDYTYNVDDHPEYSLQGYGEPVPLNHYSDTMSIVRQNISSTAKEAGSWTFLDAQKCQTEYLSCNPRTRYGDVVVIIEDDGSVGWPRSRVFNFDPSTDLAATWDKIVPPDNVNSLWFSAQCATSREPLTRESIICTNTCLGALGRELSMFYLEDEIPAQESWSVAFFPDLRPGNTSLFGKGVTYNGTLDALQISHCLAKPAASNCQIGVSNALLLTVIVCVLLKAIQGTIVIWKLPYQSLVTPGDAIQSFILQPDLYTQGLGSLDIVDSQQLEFGLRRRWTPGEISDLTTVVKPRQWTRKERRIFSVIYHTAWSRTYTILFAGLSLLLAGLVYSSLASHNNYATSLDHSNGILQIDLEVLDLSYISTLLLANAPQLIFSVCYFSYNALITRIQVEKEWNSLGQSYKPLRVSYPSGEQVSTYRLQLPYFYSIPLISISITFHWLVSNAIFLFIVDGGYFLLDLGSLTSLQTFFQVSNASFIAVGYSPGFILVVFILTLVLIILLPILLSFQWLKGDMVAGGSNSLVISAACHMTDLDYSQRNIPSPEEPDLELVEHALYATSQNRGPSNAINKAETESNTHTDLNLAQRKLRWGAMSLPSQLGELALIDGGKDALHLGFGGEEHNVSTPKEGEYYV
ncbi:hypothetical protein F4782DRAFT_517671 [Xylaria castorea]|nr:hypothetical protein F4782DRAFT_517671 [Xylaria castorea]